MGGVVQERKQLFLRVAKKVGANPFSFYRCREQSCSYALIVKRSSSTALIGFMALGIFADFFIWQLVGTAVLVHSTGFEHLLLTGYTTAQRVGYSFWLLFIGK